eukprot:11890823-Prorocentrum_lima.AAC.1
MVPEGHVGSYWKFGRLLSDTSEPGAAFTMPFVTLHENIQTTVQTDQVSDIPCGTKNGAMMTFARIE